MKDFCQKIVKSTIIIFLCSLIGFGLLCGVFKLPIDVIEKNVIKSAEEIKDEGMYPVLYDWCLSRLDNSTDTIMLLEAADRYSNDTVQAALLTYRGYIGDNSSYNALIDHYLNGTPYDGEITYARYWHGYHVYVKPLLTIMSYRSIRILNGILQNLINVFILYLLFKNHKSEYIIPYLIIYLMMMPVAMAYSLQFSSCFYVFSVCVLILLTKASRNDQKDNWMVFLFSGIATAFFDFLTYPVATIGMPLIIDQIMNKKCNFKENSLSIIKKCVYWAYGYGVMWASKWVYASILTKENVIMDGIRTFLYRTQMDNAESKMSLIEMLSKNNEKFFFTPFKYLFIAFCVVYIVLIIRSRKTIKIEVGDVITHLFLFLMPYAWYVIVSNHSMIHSYFTCKGLIVSIMAVMCFLVSLKNSGKEIKTYIND